MKQLLCWICEQHITQPLYWVDPKFYPEVEVIRHLCGPQCAKVAGDRLLYQKKQPDKC